ncbi:MAG: hypothetical protein U9R57_05710 [Thermodesulfobacteriota bacterium]|nr:hypothetical protein [Thermodesulfobacteriota bacterium]
MGTPARQETMLRKPILMPPSMIKKIDIIAKNKKVSFAKVVREAIDSFDGENSEDNAKIIDALANTMIKTTEEVVRKMEAIENRLDSTHAILEAL